MGGIQMVVVIILGTCVDTARVDANMPAVLISVNIDIC